MTSPTLSMGEGGLAKRRCYSISLFSKMPDKGEGGVKNLKKWVTSFVDGLLKVFLQQDFPLIYVQEKKISKHST